METRRRIFIKQEKRIVKLLYKKGLLKDFEIRELYWAEYKTSGKMYKYGKYRFHSYLPEIFYSTSDYWGECDEHGLVDHIKEVLYWANVVDKNADPVDGWPESTFKIIDRRVFIRYLNALPTVVHDNKIRTVLKRINQ